MTSITLPRFNLTPDITAWRGGEGPSLMLIHGVGLNAEAWYAMLPELCQHFTVSAIDMPGHGGSKPLAERPALRDYVSAIAKAIEAIDEATIVVGHSMGALIAIELAMHYEQLIRASIPLNAIHKRSESASRQVKMRARELENSYLYDLAATIEYDLAATIERWFGKSPDEAIQAMANHCEHMLNDVDKTAYCQAYSVFAHFDGADVKALQKISIPMLFMTGAKEPNSTPAMSETLAKHVTNAQWEIIDGARHMMTITHADQINQRLIRFVQDKVPCQ